MLKSAVHAKCWNPFWPNWREKILKGMQQYKSTSVVHNDSTKGLSVTWTAAEAADSTPCWIEHMSLIDCDLP